MKVTVKLLLLFNLAYIFCIPIQAQKDCKSIFPSDIKSNNSSIALKTLNPTYLSKIEELFSLSEVKGFYLGGRDASVEAKDHIERSLKIGSGSKSEFDGSYAIEKAGKFVGIFVMTSVTKQWLSEQQQEYLNMEGSQTFNFAVGYAILPEFRGEGIAKEALSLAINYARTNLEANYIFASILKLNVPSIQLVEKMGFSSLPKDPAYRSRRKFYLRMQ